MNSIIPILLASFLSPVLHAQDKPSSQWKCEAAAAWLDEDKEKIPGQHMGAGSMHFFGEGADRAAAESKALAKCRPELKKKFKTVTECRVEKCAPPTIGKNKCNDDSECNVDIAAGRCDTDVPSNIVDESGRYPLCSCNKRDHRCHLKWVEPVACKNDSDCWTAGRKFQACKDGEREPKCVANRCALKKIEGVCFKGKYVPSPSASKQPVSCTGDDDCWFAGDQPAARPKSLRGHKFRGCKDGESEPKCAEKVCVLRKLSC